mgnify:CR=1 FL=1
MSCLHGERLKKESLSVTVGGINIAELCHKSVAKALEFFENLEISDRDKLIGEQIIKEIKVTPWLSQKRWT